MQPALPLPRHFTGPLRSVHRLVQYPKQPRVRAPPDEALRIRRGDGDAGELHPGERGRGAASRSEEHTSELQSPCNLVCRLLLEKKKHNTLLLSPGNVACLLLLVKQPHINLLDTRY